MSTPIRYGLLAAAAPVLLWSGLALGQTTTTPPPAGQPRAPEMVQGEVVRIDRNTGRVTIRDADGKIHEFQANKETLQDLKEGERIQARRRQ
jgi:hypothetical protein